MSKKVLICYSLIVVLIFAGATGIGLKLNRRIWAVDAQISAKKTSILVAKQKRQALPQLRSEVETLKGLAEGDQVFVPDRESQARFVHELAKLAANNKLKITSCQINNHPIVLKNPPGYVIYQWRVDLYGDYTGLLGFLLSCEQMQRLVPIADLKIVSALPSMGEVINPAKPGFVLRISLTLDLITKPLKKGTEHGE